MRYIDQLEIIYFQPNSRGLSFAVRGAFFPCFLVRIFLLSFGVVLGFFGRHAPFCRIHSPRCVSPANLLPVLPLHLVFVFFFVRPLEVAVRVLEAYAKCWRRTQNKPGLVEKPGFNATVVEFRSIIVGGYVEGTTTYVARSPESRANLRLPCEGSVHADSLVRYRAQ